MSEQKSVQESVEELRSNLLNLLLRKYEIEKTLKSIDDDINGIRNNLGGVELVLGNEEVKE